MGPGELIVKDEYHRLGRRPTNSPTAYLLAPSGRPVAETILLHIFSRRPTGVAEAVDAYRIVPHRSDMLAVAALVHIASREVGTRQPAAHVLLLRRADHFGFGTGFLGHGWGGGEWTRRRNKISVVVVPVGVSCVATEGE